MPTVEQKRNANEAQDVLVRLRTFVEDDMPALQEAGQRSATALEKIDNMQNALDALADERKRIAQDIARLQRQDYGNLANTQDEPLSRRAVRNFLAHKRIDSEEERNALQTEMQTAIKKRALSADTLEKGAVFVTPEVSDEIVRYINNETAMLDICRVYRSNSKTFEVTVVKRRNQISWAGTETAPDNTDLLERLGRAKFEPTRPKEMVYISEDALEDTERRVEAYVLEEQGIYFADLLEYATMQGSGNQEPLGITKASLPSQQAATTANDAFGSDDIIKAVYALRLGYRRRARFAMHRSGVRQARLLKDADDQYLWQEGLEAGEPPTLAGYPVFESEYYPDHIDNGTAGQPVFTFGDFNYYGIAMRRDFGVKVYDNDHKLGIEGLVGYRFDMRGDGKPLTDEAFVTYTRGTVS